MTARVQTMHTTGARWRPASAAEVLAGAMNSNNATYRDIACAKPYALWPGASRDEDRTPMRAKVPHRRLPPHRPIVAPSTILDPMTGR